MKVEALGSLPGGLPYKKNVGCSSEILKRTPKKYQDPVYWVWLNFFFFVKRY